MQTKSSKWIVALWMIAALLVLTACQVAPPPAGTGDSAAADTAASEDPVTLTIFRGGVTIDWDTDPVILAIEEANNVDIQFLTSDWGEINQVRNLAMSTEEDIDIYHHMDTSPQWIEDELIIPLDEYINAEDHPFLYALTNSPIFAPMKRNGQTYYIPMLSDGSDWVLITRQDWMDELGVAMPTNAEEFRALLQAFKDRDPDGRSVGMQIEGSQTIRRSMMPFMAMFGVPTSFSAQERNYWVGDDGQLIPVMNSENLKAAAIHERSLRRRHDQHRLPHAHQLPAVERSLHSGGQSGRLLVPQRRQLPAARRRGLWLHPALQRRRLRVRPHRRHPHPGLDLDFVHFGQPAEGHRSAGILQLDGRTQAAHVRH